MKSICTAIEHKQPLVYSNITIYHFNLGITYHATVQIYPIISKYQMHYSVQCFQNSEPDLCSAHDASSEQGAYRTDLCFFFSRTSAYFLVYIKTGLFRAINLKQFVYIHFHLRLYLIKCHS